MTENPYDKEDLEKRKEISDESCEKDTWSEDQKNHAYYYDDAHGYEIYNADDEESEDEK